MTDTPRPIVIVGLPRSGTTWTFATLRRGAGATMAPERDNEDNNPSAIYAKRRLGRYPVLQPGDRNPEFRRLWAWILDGAYENHRIDLARKLVGPKSEERIFEGKRDVAAWLAGEIARNPRPGRRLPGETDERRVVAKSIHLQLAVEWLATEFDIDVLVLRRHPANVLASWMEVNLKDGRNTTLETRPEIRARYLEPWGIPLPGDDPVERMCWRIGLLSAALEDALSRHPEWHVRTHEDLCVDPVRKFRQLCDELDLGWTVGQNEFLESHNTPGEGFSIERVADDIPSSWETRLDGGQLETLKRTWKLFPTTVWTESDFERSRPGGGGATHP